MSHVALDAQIIKETEKAVLLQCWFGSGSNPDNNARTQWVPKSAIKVADRIVHVATWFVARNRMWDWKA